MNRRLVMVVPLLAALAMAPGCASTPMNPNQAVDTVAEVAKAKYGQEVTFNAVEVDGTNVEFTIKNASHIAFKSYRPPISIIPEPSIWDKAMDAAKWIAGFYFFAPAVEKLVASPRTVDPVIVHPDIIPAE